MTEYIKLLLNKIVVLLIFLIAHSLVVVSLPGIVKGKFFENSWSLSLKNLTNLFIIFYESFYFLLLNIFGIIILFSCSVIFIKTNCFTIIILSF